MGNCMSAKNAACVDQIQHEQSELRQPHAAMPVELPTLLTAAPASGDMVKAEIDMPKEPIILATSPTGGEPLHAMSETLKKPLMTNEYVSNGWDLIAASTQDALNVQLQNIPGFPKNVKKTEYVKNPWGKGQVAVDFDLTLGAPQLEVMDGSGQQVRVHVPLKGTEDNPSTISCKALPWWLDGPTIKFHDGNSIVLTANLAQVEASLQPHRHANKTTYDFVIDVESKDAFVDIEVSNDSNLILPFLYPKLLDFMRDHLKDVKVASVTLSNKPHLDAMIPYVADFSFVRHPTDPGRSNMLILMQTVTKTKGNTQFTSPLLPEGEQFMVLVSNKLFLEEVVMPSLVESVKKDAKTPDQVLGSMISQPLGNDMYRLVNNCPIDLKQDHDPWINLIAAQVDTSANALELQLDVKADVTFMKVHIDTWDKSWHQFTVDNEGEISLVQIKEDSGSSHSMETWKWALAACCAIPTFGISLIVAGIIYGMVGEKVPDLKGKFKDLGKNAVQWPNQKLVKLRKVEMPSQIVMFLDVTF